MENRDTNNPGNFASSMSLEDVVRLLLSHRHRGTDTPKIKYGDLEGVSGAGSSGTNLRATKSSSQSVSSGSWTKITFDNTEWDENSEWDTTNSKFVVPEDGYYLISTSLGISNPTAGYMYDIAIYKNGGEVRGCAIHSNSTTNITPQITDVLKLSKDDYIEVYLYHNTGSSVNVQSNTYNTWITIKKV